MQFGTDGIRGRAGIEITPELGRKLGNAVVRAIGAHVWVARDPRPSSPGIAEAVAQGVVEGGGFATSLGVLPTPGLSARLAEDPGSAGVMVTASHNPEADNGLKVLSAGGKKLGSGVLAALGREIDNPVRRAGGSRRNLDDGVDRYVKWLLAHLPPGTWLEGKRILVDPAMGAGAQAGRKLLEALGAQVELFSGHAINDRCGSVHPQFAAMALRKGGHDAALVLDGDGDRVAMVAADGRILDGDHLLWILREGPVMVGTVMSNLGLERALGGAGIRLHRAPVGDTFVAASMDDLAAPVGGEPSGHIIVRGGTPTADGLLVGALALARSPDLSTAGYHPCPQAHAALRDVSRTDADTAFVTEAGGRAVVRKSGTEPVVRVMVEHADVTLANTLRDRVVELLRKES
ncbi:MAG: hypothetical protein FJ090_04105 [Deltaproteobacteria bacterium]|nr:hypothetical protein [Deltaproteobacteria bacterium]